MERVQFYPQNDLKNVLQKEANEKNLSISQLVIDILNKHYGLNKKMEKRDLKEVKNSIFNEIKNYITNLNKDDEFDLLSASHSFKDIHMTANGRPSTNRAIIGKIFASKIGKDEFENIAISRQNNGNIKRSLNKATIYKVIK